jgi:hypothetical protein
MAINLSGSPKTVLDVVDQSIIKDVPIAGIGIVQGPTQRGKIGVPHFIGNPLQYSRILGGDFAAGESKFPVYCKRILNAGGKLYVIRAGHYTTIADKSTLVGTKAAATIAISANNSVWNAEEVGAGYNGTTIVITAAASGDANLKDIVITLKDSDTSIPIKDVKRAMSAGEISDFNARLRGLGAGVVLVSIATQIENGTGTLASGAQVVSAIVAADYQGDPAGQNGWYVADKVTDAMRIANIGLPGDEDVDTGLSAYVNLRKDMRFYIGTPLGINAVGMAAYRNGTTPYSNTPLDTLYGSLIGADVTITDSANKDLTFDIPGVVDTFAQRLITDQRFAPWISHAGGERGKIISPNNGIPFNLGSPALAADFDNIYNIGVNAVISDPDYGPVYWGNKSLYRNANSMLSKENVADTIVYIIRRLKPLVRIKMFNPNDPNNWKAIYLRVKPLFDELEANRAIVPGEDVNWFWQGDQNADRREDAKFNTQQDLDSGRYRARFVFIPIVATEYIGIEVVPTDSNSVKFVVQENVIV